MTTPNNSDIDGTIRVVIESESEGLTSTSGSSYASIAGGKFDLTGILNALNQNSNLVKSLISSNNNLVSATNANTLAMKNLLQQKPGGGVVGTSRAPREETARSKRESFFGMKIKESESEAKIVRLMEESLNNIIIKREDSESKINLKNEESAARIRIANEKSEQGEKRAEALNDIKKETANLLKDTADLRKEAANLLKESANLRNENAQEIRKRQQQRGQILDAKSQMEYDQWFSGGMQESYQSKLDSDVTRLLRNAEKEQIRQEEYILGQTPEGREKLYERRQEEKSEKERVSLSYAIGQRPTGGIAGLRYNAGNLLGGLFAGQGLSQYRMGAGQMAPSGIAGQRAAMAAGGAGLTGKIPGVGGLLAASPVGMAADTITKPLGDIKNIMGNILGVFTIGTAFKNSKVANNLLGTISTILGAMMDVFIAPFMPLIVPLLQKLIEWIPKISKWSEGFVERFLQDPLGAIKEELSKLKPMLQEGWNTFWEWAKPQIVGIWDNIAAWILYKFKLGPHPDADKIAAEKEAKELRDLNDAKVFLTMMGQQQTGPASGVDPNAKTVAGFLTPDEATQRTIFGDQPWKREWATRGLDAINWVSQFLPGGRQNGQTGIETMEQLDQVLNPDMWKTNVGEPIKDFGMTYAADPVVNTWNDVRTGWGLWGNNNNGNGNNNNGNNGTSEPIKVTTEFNVPVTDDGRANAFRVNHHDDKTLAEFGIITTTAP